MEPARRYLRIAEPEDEPELDPEEARKIEFQTKIGKSIFYGTVALAFWFFYWLNGINCPCQ